jgi:hypothetical protein
MNPAEGRWRRCGARTRAGIPGGSVSLRGEESGRRPVVRFQVSANTRSASSTLLCAREHVAMPRRVGGPMSQIQPADCAVEMVCEAIGARFVGMGHLHRQRGVVEQDMLLGDQRHTEMIA